LAALKMERTIAGMDPAKLTKLRAWLRDSDERGFAAVVIRRGYLVLEEERLNSGVAVIGELLVVAGATSGTAEPAIVAD
jgi:hypothetical protein